MKQLYTQEMRDNNLMPEVDMQALVKITSMYPSVEHYNGAIVTITKAENGYGCYFMWEGVEVFLNDLQFQPIPVEPCKAQYTQAMVDQGLRCEVGMQCMIEVAKGCQKESGELLGWRGKEVWVLLYDGMCTTVIKSSTPVIFPMVPVVVKTSKELLEAAIENAIRSCVNTYLPHSCEEELLSIIMDDFDTSI